MNHKIHAGKGMEKKIQQTYLNKKKDSQSSGERQGGGARQGRGGGKKRKGISLRRQWVGGEVVGREREA